MKALPAPLTDPVPGRSVRRFSSILVAWLFGVATPAPAAESGMLTRGHPLQQSTRPRGELSHVGFAYQVRPSLTFSCDLNNLTNVEQRQYRGIPDQVQQRLFQGTSITLGISGRF